MEDVRKFLIYKRSAAEARTVQAALDARLASDCCAHCGSNKITENMHGRPYMPYVEWHEAQSEALGWTLLTLAGCTNPGGRVCASCGQNPSPLPESEEDTAEDSVAGQRAEERRKMRVMPAASPESSGSPEGAAEDRARLRAALDRADDATLAAGIQGAAEPMPVGPLKTISREEFERLRENEKVKFTGLTQTLGQL
jgi:hypothetical protein